MSTSDTNALVRHIQQSSGTQALSLTNRVNALARRGEDNIILLDCSSSMAEEINYNEPKIDALWSIVQSLRGQGLEFRIAEFNDEVCWSDGVVRPEPRGSTALAEALSFVASVKPRQVTVITDGYPNNPQAAFLSAAQLGCKINCLYVGPSGDTRAQDFCRQLAEACGGAFGHNDLKTEQLQLQAAQSARLMLTEGSNASQNKRGAIQL